MKFEDFARNRNTSTNKTKKKESLYSFENFAKDYMANPEKYKKAETPQNSNKNATTWQEAYRYSSETPKVLTPEGQAQYQQYKDSSNTGRKTFEEQLNGNKTLPVLQTLNDNVKTAEIRQEQMSERGNKAQNVIDGMSDKEKLEFAEAATKLNNSADFWDDMRGSVLRYGDANKLEDRFASNERETVKKYLKDYNLSEDEMYDVASLLMKTEKNNPYIKLYNNLPEEDRALLDETFYLEANLSNSDDAYYSSWEYETKRTTSVNPDAIKIHNNKKELEKKYGKQATKALYRIYERGVGEYVYGLVGDYAESEVNGDGEAVLSSAMSVPLNLVGGVLSPVALAQGYIDSKKNKAYGLPSGGTLDTNNPYYLPSKLANAERQTVTNTYDWNVDVPVIGEKDAFDFLYNTGMSGVDSLTSSALGSAGVFALAGNAAVNSSIESEKKGVTPEQAIVTAVGAGVAEYIFEKISLGNFKAWQEVDTKSLRNIVTNVLKSVVVNASEESLTETANIITDTIVNQDKSDFMTNVAQYEAQGYSTENAVVYAVYDALLQVGEAGVSGGLMGFGFSGAGSVSSYASNIKNASQTGKAIKSEGLTDAVVEAGRTSNDKLVQKYVDKINKKGVDKASNVEIGSVARELMKGGETTDAALETISSYTRPINLSSTEKVQITHPTLDKVDGKVVSLSSVESVNNGNITVKNSNGETQTLDLNKLEGKAKELWTYASEHFSDAQTIESFVQNYNGRDVDTYSQAYKSVFDLASVGMTSAQITREDLYYSRVLGEKAFNSAVESGNTAMSYKEGVVDLTTQKKTYSQKLVMNMANEFGKRHGMNITFVDTLGTKEGFYRPNSNQIVIALDSSRGAIARTLGHETYHYVEQQSGVQAGQISDFVIDTLTNIKGKEWVESRYAFYEKQGYKTLDKQKSELVADQMFEVFANERAVNEFVAKDRTLAQRVLDHVKGLIAEIKNIYKKLVASGHYDDIAAWQEDLKALEKVNDMMLDALANIEQRKNTGQKAEKNTSGEVVNSFARIKGEKSELLNIAEKMENEGASREEIWKKLGVIRDASGIWVYEIDDSEMKIYPNGDAQLRKEEGYKRMTELFNRFISGEKLTEAELKEYSELQKEYNIRKKMTVFLKDFVSHDKLFKEYPELEWVSFEFDDLKDKNTKGYFSPGINAIVVDESLKKQIESRQLEKTAIHEIQHAVQHIDDRTGGSSTEYFEEQQKWFRHYKKSVDEFLEKNGLKDFVKSSMKEVADGKKSIDEHWADLDEWAKKTVNNLGSAMVQSHYNSMLRYKRYMSGDAESLYLNTAGEIEARETADRLKMTAEERAKIMPDLGWERAVFADGTVTGYDIINLDNGMSYVKSSRKVISGNNKSKWRKQISDFFNNALKQNPQIKITTINGDVLYITKDTATKARDSSVTVNGQKRKLSDNEFFVKLEAAAHIDELSEISTVNNNGKRTPDSKNHSFAQDGFTYRTVYFEDSNNQYYKVTLSIGHNGNIATIYNVGQIKKDSMPNGKIISRIGSKADILSTDIISNDSKTVKQNFSTKREQLDIINETNPAPNTYSTWIRTVDDIKTLSETLDDPDWDYEEFNPDLTRADIQNAIKKGQIKVYSSYPIKNGVFVSPSRMEAESYSGNGKVYEKTVDINDVAWIDPTQGQFAKADKAYSTKRDAGYMTAVENGDMKTAQRMVDEVAKEKGYTPEHLYHGTNEFGFTSFDMGNSDDGISFFMSDKQSVSQGYMSYNNNSTDAYHNAPRRIGKKSDMKRTALSRTSSVDKVIDTLKKQFPYYAEARQATESDVVSYLQKDISVNDAVSSANELLNLDLLDDVRALAESVVNASEDGSYNAWKNVADKYSEFDDVYDVTENIRQWNQALDLWDNIKRGVYTASDIVQKDSVYHNGKVENKSALIKRYNNSLQGESNGMYDLYANHSNQLVIEGNGAYWIDLPLGKMAQQYNDWWVNVKGNPALEGAIYTNGDTRSISEFAKAIGYHSVRFNNIYDSGASEGSGELSTVYSFFYPSQDIKSADPVTYDDDGNIIPPSQRFDESKDDIRYSSKRAETTSKNPNELTENDVKRFMKDAINGNLHEGTYFPIRRNTPKILIESAMNKNGDVVENLPIVIQVKKATAHGITPEDMISIVKAMDAPQYIIYQEDNDRYVEVVKYDASTGSKAIAVLEIGDYKSESHLNGYKGGSYNVLVTAFEPNVTYVSDILSKSTNNVIYEKKKGASQVTFGSTVPSVLNESPFAISISENSNNVNGDNKFSTKREPSISEDASDYILDTKEYKEVIKLVDQRYNLTNKKNLSPKAIERLAGKLLSNSKSKYDKGALTERLSALFDYMANSNELVWKDVMKTAAEISHDILSQSSSLDRSMQNQYKDTLDYLKGLTVYISPEVRAEINSRYGSLENYRRMLGGKTKITVTDSSKMSLDSLWKELNEYHPEMFDADVSSLDQAEELVNFFEMTKPTYVNQFEYYWDMNEASYDFALQIYEEYFNIPEVQTESQRHKLEMERLKGKQNAKIAQIRKEYKDRIKRIRAEKNSKIEATKELYRERNRQYREKRNDTAERQKLRRQIVRETKKLTEKLVNPTDQKHIPQELIVGINSFAKAMTEHGAFPAQRAAKLQRAFKNIGEKATDPDFNIASMYDEEIDVMLDGLTSVLSNKRLGEMTSAELSQVRDIARYFSHIVSMSNQAFSDGIKEKLSELQTSTFDEVASQSKDKKRMMYKMQTGLLKPVTFFEILESPTLEKLYTNIRKGEESWARIVLDAKQKRIAAQEKYEYKKWADDKVDITTERGDKLSISVKEALSIYATSKRKQGVEHIMKGGIVLEEEARKQLEKKNRFSKNKDKSVNVRSANVPLSLADIQNINSSLTNEQKAYADELVRYMSSDMAKLGNEVSMKLYGIQKYNEDYYFPLKSASNFLYSEPGVENDSRIKHMSMTKRTVPKANNPVVIGDFTETAMSHCNDMALYYGFTLPLEDFKRVWNYKTPTIEGTTPSSIKQQIDMVYGDKANKYIKQMLSDINGGVTKQAGADVVNRMISLAKKNAVFASLSVAVQQPSAIARSLAYIDPKYFVGHQKKGTWAEIKKYAPVAVVKEMGYFDTGIGRQAVDWMTETEYEGLKEKAFALFKDSNYRDDVLSFLPSYMDEISWGRIWVAVKNETKAKNPDLDVKSEEFLNKVGERFTYVIDRTQVYDSVFSRSEWMRSKDTGMKVATAFMAEPLTNYNLLYNAAIKAKNGDKKFAARAIIAYAVSVAFNSMLKSFITAARNDDDDEYWRKYLSEFLSALFDEPLGMIPYFKDLFSLLKGYDSNRMDTQVLADIASAIKTLTSDKKHPYEKVKSVVGAVGVATGIPLKNLWREIEMILKVFGFNINSLIK